MPVSPPFELISYQYRKIFHLTPQEFREIDWNDILTDLDIMSVEADFRGSPEEIE